MLDGYAGFLGSREINANCNPAILGGSFRRGLAASHEVAGGEGPNAARNVHSFAYTPPVKKLIAFIFALVSGLYLLIWGPMIGPLDPVPIVDEATALLIFVKSMAVLGVDLSRFVPFLGRKSKTPPKPPGPVVDV